MKDEGWIHFGDLIESAIYSAKRDWRDDWAKGTAIDDLLANPLQEIETSISQRPKGRLDVIVRIISAKPHQREAFLYKFQRSAGSWIQLN
jgi:hypothetical protein